MHTWTVVGTDTGIGKTIVCAALACVARQNQIEVRVLKPVQTGFPGDDDAAAVNQLVGEDVAQRGRSLAAPLAPAVAARLEHLELDPGELLSWVRSNASAMGTTVVETAGGAAVEIVAGYDMAHLASDLGWPVLVVCRPGLGTLNHTLLTLEHLRRAGAQIAGLVINRLPARATLDVATNMAELERLTSLRIEAVLPALGRARSNPATLRAQAPHWFSPGLGGSFNREHFLETMGSLAGG